GHAANELRADPVADGEQEHQEHGRLERRRDRDAQLPDDDGGEERRGDRPEADALDGEAAGVIADAERQEDGDLGIAPERLSEPLKHAALRWPSAPRARLA